MKRSAAVGIAILIAVATHAQQYLNEWVDHAATYYKFPVHRKSIYRIDSAALSTAFDLSTADPRNLRLYLLGREQPLFISGEGDGRINTGDYAEFYADPAASQIDSLLYHEIRYNPNPFAPLFNDTVYAYLQLAGSPSARRIQQVSDTSTAGLAQSDYFYTHSFRTSKAAYNTVNSLDAQGLISDPLYTQAEGWGMPFNKGETAAFQFSGLGTYTDAPLPFYITAGFAGMSQELFTVRDHHILTGITAANGQTIQLNDTSFYGFATSRRTYSVNAQQMSSSPAVTFFSSPDAEFSSFQNATIAHYAGLFYPHSISLVSGGLIQLWIDDAAQGKSFYRMTGLSGAHVMYDNTNSQRITVNIAAGYATIVVPNGGKKHCVLQPAADIVKVSKLIRVAPMRNLSNAQGRVYVMIYHPIFSAEAAAYASYRMSAAGGGYEVLSMPASEMYDQFGYGCNKHPVAIRKMLGYLYNKLPAPPAAVLLIGKAAESPGLGPSVQTENLVPTMGVPSCDNLLAASLWAGANPYVVQIPIGRIAATKPSEVATYLAKVKEHDSNMQGDWKKRVLHFVGGDAGALQQTLSAYMKEFERIISDTLYGAEVFTFSKTTSAPIQSDISDSVRTLINGGAAIMNIFGHGSQQGFDQTIDDPNMYNNTGRYPVFIANSCFSGDIHIPFKPSVSEKFVFANRRGSIVFLASSGYGQDFALNNFTRNFYDAAAHAHYNGTVGEMVRYATQKTGNSLDIYSRITGLDMTLHGDPAVRISSATLPDYQVTNSGIRFDSERYTDSIGVMVRYSNKGKAIQDSLTVTITRLLPGGDTMMVTKRKRAAMYHDSLRLYLPLDFERGVGLNRFKVAIDPEGRIAESDEGNNVTGMIDHFIVGADLAPVYPYRFAVVPLSSGITLKASTNDPYAPSARYVFQLDTTDSFSSPVQSTTITSRGGVLEWKVNVPAKDSAVYFWRVSRDSVSPQAGFVWRESSFQMIGTERGWGQAHFLQRKGNAHQYITYDPTRRRYDFVRSRNSVSVRNGIHPFLDLSLINFYFNNATADGWSSAFDGWNFALFDSISGEPQEILAFNNVQTGPGPFNACVENRRRRVYSFGATSKCNNANWKQDMENFLAAVPANCFILGYTTGYQASKRYADIYSYSNSLYNLFESVGAKSIRKTTDTVAYSFFGKKGTNYSHEEIAKHKRAVIYLNDSVPTNWSGGAIASELIGPSYSWKQLRWQVRSDDSGAGDTTILKVVGYRPDGTADTLCALPHDSINVQLANYVNAAQHPYIRLIAFARDRKFRTSPQLSRWHVLFDEAPECAINPLRGIAADADTVQEGQHASFRFYIENISHVPFRDSLATSYWILDQQKQKKPLAQRMRPPGFAPGELIIDTVIADTYKLRGRNSIWMFVNQQNEKGYQHEQHQFNNVVSRPFSTFGDITNPLLDVTFDGARIMNGDLVSARPQIMISLKDENKFLALNDTGAFTIQLQAPGQQVQPVYFAQGLQFTPASLPRNSASILYTPALYADGRYTLKVQATDRSNNKSARSEYVIDFEVNNKPTVTHVINYPNPFSSSTRFVFTLSGSEIPEVFTIQIMTITGKIVREITREELGRLRIGRNVTEFAWNGTDEFGDRLANGVYLYRVVTRLNGQSIERNETAVDKYFVKEFGKMVLMR